MKRASYRDAVDVEQVSGLTTCVMIASIFGVEPEKVAQDVVRLRKKLQASENV